MTGYYQEPMSRPQAAKGAHGLLELFKCNLYIAISDSSILFIITPVTVGQIL